MNQLLRFRSLCFLLVFILSACSPGIEAAQAVQTAPPVTIWPTIRPTPTFEPVTPVIFDTPPTPPPTASPGPPPTPLPTTTTDWIPLTDWIEAVNQALYFDALTAPRETPLTWDFVAEHPDAVVAEYYETHEGAANWYPIGHYTDPAEELQPVWVVKFKVETEGLMLPGFGGFDDLDGVSYILGARSGYLLVVAGGFLEKQEQE